MMNEKNVMNEVVSSEEAIATLLNLLMQQE